MADIPWERLEGEKVGQKFLLGGIASIVGDQAWFHATAPERPGDDVSVVCAPEQKRGWLPRITELKHPSLRVILGAGKCVLHGAAIRYCAMEPSGLTLAERLPREAPLSVTIVRELIGHLIDALGALHENHLVACQLSPASIAQMDGRWKLTDFTRVREVGRVPASSTRSLLTISPCAPPEAFDGVVSPAWDIYSLGVTINQCLLSPGAVKRGRTQLLPAPFDMIARLCLDPKPENRLALADIAMILRLPQTGAVWNVRAEEEAPERARVRGSALRWLPTGA